MLFQNHYDLLSSVKNKRRFFSLIDFHYKNYLTHSLKYFLLCSTEEMCSVFLHFTRTATRKKTIHFINLII